MPRYSLDRQERRLVSQVPFAEATSDESPVAQDLGNRFFIGVKPPRLTGPEHPHHGSGCRADSLGMRSGHEGSPGWCVDRRRGIERRELHPLSCHPVQVRRVVAGGAEWSDIPESHLIDEYDHEIGWHRLSVSGAARADQHERHEARDSQEPDGPRGSLKWLAIGHRHANISPIRADKSADRRPPLMQRVETALESRLQPAAADPLDRLARHSGRPVLIRWNVPLI